MNRPFMRSKIMHLGIYEKIPNLMSRPFKGILRIAFLLGESRKYVDSQRESAKNSIPASLLVNLHGKVFITTH
jgi:hypothetical protein